MSKKIEIDIKPCKEYGIGIEIKKASIIDQLKEIKWKENNNNIDISELNIWFSSFPDLEKWFQKVENIYKLEKGKYQHDQDYNSWIPNLEGIYKKLARPDLVLQYLKEISNSSFLFKSYDDIELKKYGKCFYRENPINNNIDIPPEYVINSMIFWELVIIGGKNMFITKKGRYLLKLKGSKNG